MIELTKKEKIWLKKVFAYLTSIQNLPSKNWDTPTFNSAAQGTMKIVAGSVDAVWQAAMRIRDTFNKGDFNNIDSEIRTLADGTNYFSQKANAYKGLSYTEVLDALAGLCAINNIPFNPKGEYTTFEKAQFEKTDFGKALVNARNAHAQPSQPGAGTNPTQSTTTSSQGTSSAGGSTTTNKGAHDSVPTAGNYIDGKASVHTRSVAKKDPTQTLSTYKSEGPKSGLVFNMKSVPGRKEQMTGDQGYVFVIAAEDSTTTKNKPLAFINPLINTKNYRNQTTNIVKLGSAHGYSDLTLYFNTFKDAEAFMVKLVQANKVSSKYTNVRVEKRDLNGRFKYMFDRGFYRVGTDLGDVYVCASKLNEAVEADADEVELTEATNADNFDVESWKAELKELSETAPWK